jgi:hypothetical protein
MIGILSLLIVLNSAVVFAQQPATEVHSSVFDITVSTDKTQYNTNEVVLIDLSITNVSESVRTVDAVVTIEDRLGNLVKSVVTLSEMIFSVEDAQSISDLTYNTGTRSPGDYRVHVQLYQRGIKVGESFSPFQILSM